MVKICFFSYIKYDNIFWGRFYESKKKKIFWEKKIAGRKRRSKYFDKWLRSNSYVQVKKKEFSENQKFFCSVVVELIDNRAR